jgi:2-polyprenyl-3-methyl-5-hydroxy-6-metoxy-1,4-benzoquinol methylase
MLLTGQSDSINSRDRYTPTGYGYCGDRSMTNIRSMQRPRNYSDRGDGRRKAISGDYRPRPRGASSRLTDHVMDRDRQKNSLRPSGRAGTLPNHKRGSTYIERTRRGRLHVSREGHSSYCKTGIADTRVSVAKRFYYARVLPLTFRDLSDSDCAVMRDFGISRVPPPSLRFRVHGPVDVASFLGAAKSCVDAITAAFALAGESVPGSNGKILDFGCGSGRTLLFWLKMPVPPELYGVDIDGEAIAWARDNVPVKVQQISPRPPLEYPDNFFDAIYSISVFTHLKRRFPSRVAG